MAHVRFLSEYRKSAVQGATPLQLILMLYDGAMRHMEAGRHSIAVGDREAQNASLQKAQRVVFELMACLDMDRGGEIASNLLALYSYVIDQLVQANLQDDPEAAERAIKVFTDLRESWSLIERAASGGKADQKAAA